MFYAVPIMCSLTEPALLTGKRKRGEAVRPIYGLMAITTHAPIFAPIYSHITNIIYQYITNIIYR